MTVISQEDRVAEMQRLAEQARQYLDEARRQLEQARQRFEAELAELSKPGGQPSPKAASSILTDTFNTAARTTTLSATIGTGFVGTGPLRGLEGIRKFEEPPPDEDPPEDRAGVRGQTDSHGAAVLGRAFNGAVGVMATSESGGTAIDAKSGGGTAVKAVCERGVAVNATSDIATAVIAVSSFIGVTGQSSGSDPVGIGVEAQATGGIGLLASGGRCQIMMTPAASSGPPPTGTHESGELYLDKNAELFLYRASETSGTWVRVVTAPA